MKHIKVRGFMGRPVTTSDEPFRITKDGVQYFSVDISPDSDWLVMKLRLRGKDSFNIYEKPEKTGEGWLCIASFDTLDEAVQKYEELINNAVSGGREARR